MSDGTVLHEIQSLERQLDRLMPTLDKFNSRISTIEADVRNITSRLDALKCSETQGKLNTLDTTQQTTAVELKKDIESLVKDIAELDTDRKEEKRTTGERVWSIVERFLGALIGAGVAYLAMKK